MAITRLLHCIAAVVLFVDVVLAMAVPSSVGLAASSSNVVILLWSVCVYIEMPTNAVDIATSAEKSDSNAIFFVP